MTLMFDSEVILWGEIRCQSLLGVKGLAKFKLARFYRTIFFVNASNNETKFFLHIAPFQSCVKISRRIISVFIFENEVTGAWENTFTSLS